MASLPVIRILLLLSLLHLSLSSTSFTTKYFNVVSFGSLKTNLHFKVSDVNGVLQHRGACYGKAPYPGKTDLYPHRFLAPRPISLAYEVNISANSGKRAIDRVSAARGDGEDLLHMSWSRKLQKNEMELKLMPPNKRAIDLITICREICFTRDSFCALEPVIFRKKLTLCLRYVEPKPKDWYTSCPSDLMLDWYDETLNELCDDDYPSISGCTMFR